MRQRLSVAIIAKNEALRIRRCLDSVTWADEIVVVDGCSTDGTDAICLEYGAKVIRHAFEGSFAQERNLGIEQATGDWLLHLDADDVVTPQMRAAVERVLAAPQPYEIFKFRRKSYLLGRYMRYGGWQHYLPNFFRRGTIRFEGDVHERPRTDGPIGILEADVEHHPFRTLAEFIDRQNRYTSLKASELFKQRPALPPREVRRQILYKSAKIFWKSYVKKQGFREGLHGLIFAWLYAWVHVLTYAKYWELQIAAEQSHDRRATA